MNQWRSASTRVPWARALTIAALVGLVGLPVTTATAATNAALPSDFNGDGYADLAIGVPGEEVSGHQVSGAVNVLYGSAHGLTAADDQRWTLDSPGVKGRAYKGAGQYFGQALASGDFDRDGHADLAVGTPRDRVGTVFPHPGAVHVLYGTGHGLTASGDQRWSQANLPGEPGRDDEFGDALAAGDFDGDGYWDLAIGVPGEAVDGIINRGIVQILYGGADGLSSSGTATLTRAMTGAAYEPNTAHWFGATLAARDIDGDGTADLAVGAPSAHDGPGDVGVFYGSADGVSTVGVQLWSQESPGLTDDLDDNDRFGQALTIGDFNADGHGDLVIGISESFGSAEYAGRLNVLYGTATGLDAAGADSWSRDTPGIPGATTGDDEFGLALAAGNFDGVGADELAIGSRSPDGSGDVVVMVGGSGGLSATGARAWTQQSAGVPGTREDDDLFGLALASANYGRSGRDDLAIGVPGENGFRGMVNVLYGHSGGLSGERAQGWSQNTAGVAGTASTYDFFGHTLTP